MPSKTRKTISFGVFVEISIIYFSVQRITRYPLLIKQILQYTEPDQDRELTERALRTAERILDTINEAIREQEGRDRLKALSQDLWIGQGCVPQTLVLDIHAFTFNFYKTARSDSADAAPRRSEITKRGTSQQSQKRAQVAGVPLQRSSAIDR